MAANWPMSRALKRYESLMYAMSPVIVPINIANVEEIVMNCFVVRVVFVQVVVHQNPNVSAADEVHPFASLVDCQLVHNYSDIDRNVVVVVVVEVRVVMNEVSDHNLD
jgi:hypothetical protein